MPWTQFSMMANEKLSRNVEEEIQSLSYIKRQCPGRAIADLEYLHKHCLFVWNYSWAWPMDSYQTFKLNIMVLLERRRKHISPVYPWNTWNLFSMVFLNFIVVITFNNSFLKTKTQQVKRNPLELLTFPYFDLNKAKLFSSCIIIHFYVSIPLFLFPSEMSFSIFFTGLIFTCHLKIL